MNKLMKVKDGDLIQLKYEIKGYDKLLVIGNDVYFYDRVLQTKSNLSKYDVIHVEGSIVRNLGSYQQFLLRVRDEGSIHADNMPETHDFYKEYFSDTMYNENDYSGETINSFATYIGALLRTTHEYVFKGMSMPSTAQGRLSKVKELLPECYDDFITYYNMYHTKANFMPMVHGTLNPGKNKLNNDYMYTTLLKIREYLMNDDKSWPLLYDDNNKDYFEPYIGNFGAYLKDNYLQAWEVNGELLDFRAYNLPTNQSKSHKLFKVENFDEVSKAKQDEIMNFIKGATHQILARSIELAKVD